MDGGFYKCTFVGFRFPRGILQMYICRVQVPYRGILQMYICRVQVPYRGILQRYICRVQVPSRGILQKYICMVQVPYWRGDSTNVNLYGSDFLL